MEFHDRLKPKNWKGESFSYAQVKLDGFRITVYKDENGLVHVYGRKVREDLEFATRYMCVGESEWLAKCARHMPEQSSVDGELWVPGKPASDVPKVLASGRWQALDDVPRCESLQFTAFAIPMWAGVELHDATLEHAAGIVGSMGLDFAHYMDAKKLRPHIGWPEDQEECYDLLAKAADAYGYEGWVLKRHNYRDWYKVKGESTVDCIVTGWKEGKGKFLGQVGALEMSLIKDSDAFTGSKPGELIEGIDGTYVDWIGLRTVASVSGMDDTDRMQMTELADNYPTDLIGRVAEIKYQYVGAGGRLRHPRFVRWRADKPRWECKLCQIHSTKGKTNGLTD